MPIRPVFQALATTAVVVPLALAIAGSAPTPNLLATADRAAAPGSTAHRAALRQAWTARSHPQWKTLSPSARIARLAMLGERAMKSILATSSTSDAAPSPAPFQGNLTLIQGPSGTAIALQRQADCSLSFFSGTYSLSLTAPTISVQPGTPGYQDVLHTAAGLGTTPDVFAHGCAEPATGLGSRRGVYLGKTSAGLYMSAAVGYDPVAQTDALYYGTVDVATNTVHAFAQDHTITSAAGMTAGDLNGDGLQDVVELDQSAGSVVVWLAHADGTLGAPVRYTTTGTRATAAVLADVDGDGKLDLVVSGASTGTAGESVAVLLGRGDGTFQAARTMAVTSPAAGTNGASTTLSTMVAADFRGTGKPDIVGSNGLVLLNDGSGHFTQAPAFAFPVPQAANTFAPFLATGDFDEDGKPDVVVSTGSAVTVWRGRGDGTFVAGRSYATDDAVGYVSATDLDGDGHLDLYIGLANGGLFGGDQYGVRTGYALMGRGDGTFSGAPVLPFQFTGRNLADLNGDGILDGVGLSADAQGFTTALGDGHGGFTPQSTLSVATITLNGTPFALDSVDSYDLADVDGDGHVDLVFLGTGFNARNGTTTFATPGFLIARGDGHGGFAAPAFVPAPSFVAVTDIDVNFSISNLRLVDVDGDGKPDLVYNYDDISYTSHVRTVGTAIQRGNGDGTFQLPHTLVYRSGPDDGTFGFNTARVQQVADVNHDGKPDLILVAQSTTLDHEVGGYASTLQVALGNGDGSFATPVTAPGPDVLPANFSETVPIVVADMNGDGIPDLVTLGGSTGYDLQVAIALGNGDGTFKTPSRTTFTAQYLGGSQQIAVADLNGDGKPDVVVTNPFGAAGIAFGAGDGTLAPLGSAGAAQFNQSLVLPTNGTPRVMDFDGDGKLDILAGDVMFLQTSASASSPTGFTLSADSAAGTLKAGASAQSHLTLTPGNGFTGTVSFTCAGLPAGAACAFAPASVAVNGTAASTTLTISTTAAAAAGLFGRIGPLPPMGIAIAALTLAMVRRRAIAAIPRRRAAWAGVALAGAATLAGCSDSDSVSGTAPPPTGGATPAGTYTIAVTASGGGVSKSVNYVLTVQ